MPEYGASSITVLEGLEAVRKRPGMYIGDTAVYGLHHLVYEVVDNSSTRRWPRQRTEIVVTIHVDGSVSVKDNGRGIPVGPHPTVRGMDTVDVVMTKLHAGGKFENSAYKVSGGLHGVGVSVRQRALRVASPRDLPRTGRCTSSATPGACLSSRSPRSAPPTSAAPRCGSSRTRPSSRPPTSTSTMLSQRLRELAFLNAGLKITITDERSQKSHDFKFEGGIVSFVEFLNKSKDVAPLPGVLQGGEGRRRAGDRDAVERWLRRAHLHLRQQHQHPRGRKPPVGLQERAHPHHQQLRGAGQACGRT